jgi:arginase family enzyme
MTPLEELRLLLKPAGGGLYLVSTGRAEQLALQRRFYDASTDDDITKAFEATLSKIETAKVVILGVPSDVGAGFRRGANLGPQAIRTQLLEDDASRGQAPRNNWSERGIVDVGDVFVVPQLLHDDMLSEGQLRASRDALYPDVKDRDQLPVSPLSIAERALALIFQINPKAKPFVLGGDHSVAWPVVKAMHDGGKRFAIVQPDAHTDLLETRLGIKICFATWTWHANELVGKQGRVIQVGIRATRYPKDHWERTLGVKQYWAKDVRARPDEMLDEIVAAAKQTALPVYFSNDIDGTDAKDADATGTPEPDGLEVAWLETLIARLGAEVGLAGADLVEVAPVLGGKRTVEVAARYARATLNALLA